MTVRRLIIVLCLAAAPAVRADVAPPTELDQGIQAYQEERLMTALGHFVRVIEREPANAQAHAYIHLIVQKMQVQQARRAHEENLSILTATSQLLESRRMDSTTVDHAIQRTQTAEANRQAEEHAECTTARMEAQLGHLLVANDLVLQAIARNPTNPEAQQLLSLLQSQIRESLDSRKNLPIPERRALEGFYAYGQADYAAAAAAWGQARSTLDAVLPADEVAHQVARLHFDSYDKISRQHLEEERQQARARDLFSEGLNAFQNHDFDKSLQAFRQVALLNPDYSQLGAYLVQSEAAVERERTSSLTEAKRDESAQTFAKGLSSFEKGNYADAKSAFQSVLALDPAHPQARLYLQQIEAKRSKASDPEAAQQHYEAGLIAFVSGDMEQATREWHIALRFDPENPKVMGAINRAQRELNSSKELL